MSQDNSEIVFSQSTGTNHPAEINQDFNYDSVSMQSNASTIYDSDYVAASIRRLEREQPVANTNPSSSQNNQMNLHINMMNHCEFFL